MQFSKLASAAIVAAAAVSAAPSGNRAGTLDLVRRATGSSGNSGSKGCKNESDFSICCSSNNLVCVPGGWIQGSCPTKQMCCSPNAADSNNQPGSEPLSGLLGPITKVLSDFNLGIDIDAVRCVKVF